MPQAWLSSAAIAGSSDDDLLAAMQPLTPRGRPLRDAIRTANNAARSVTVIVLVFGLG